MLKSFVTLLLILCLLLPAGCSLITGGEAEWELCVGVRTKQISDKPAIVSVESTIVTRIVNSFTDGKVSPDE